MASPFHSVLFPPNIDRGAKGGPSWSTTVVVTQGGDEQRIGQWSRARSSWDVGHSLRTPAQYQELYAFWMARRGRLFGFLYKDWGDHSSDVAGTPTQHLTAQIDSNHFQLQKGYGPAPFTVYRKITKPLGDDLGDTAATGATSTVRMFSDTGSEIVGGWEVDLTSGIVAFSAAPGFVPLAEFSFSIPVRFDSDKMNASLDEVTYQSWPGIALVELKE